VDNMDLSNKALALVLIIATTISIVGTILTVTRLDLAGPSYIVTGRAATDTGTTNFSINTTISVAFTQNNVDFGTGIVNASGSHNCTLNTTGPGMLAGGTNPTGGPDCIGFNASVQPLRIQNQGTSNVTLNVTFSQTATTFVGGTSPSFSYRSSWNETSSSCGGNGLNSNTSVNEVASANSNISLCNATRFNWVANSRTLNLDLGIKIPQDAPTGTRLVTITAYASSP
jgi:hypothetical protein